jgi:hypothetical protein
MHAVLKRGRSPFRHMSRIGPRSVLMVIAVLTLAACSQSPSSSTWVAPSVADRVPHFGASNQLPLDKYQLTDRQLSRMQSEEAGFLTDCANKYSVQVSFFGDYLRPADSSTLMTGQPLGTLTASEAAATGYHAAAPSRAWAPVGGLYVRDPSNVRPSAPNATPQRAENLNDVLFGPAASSETPSPNTSPLTDPTDKAGRPVPQGGCWGELEKELRSPLETVTSLRIKLINLSFKQKDVRAAMARWSGCMKDAGHSYKAVQGPSQAFSLLPLGPKEKTVASIDVRCTRESNWANIFYDVLGNYESQAVRKDPNGLRGVRASEEARLRALDGLERG